LALGGRAVPIQFPQNIAEMIDNWENCPDEDVGWYLLCDGPIRSENGIMPNSNTHNCTEGLRMEF
jgi:hypothetical protein